MAPKITVVTRFVKSDGWENGFPVNCVKYGPDKYSSMFEIDKTFREEIVYQGECPAQLRILTRVDPKFLKHYMNFYSQKVPKQLDLRVADAVRNVCNGMFDGEAYLPTGEIISYYMKDHSDELSSYLCQFFRHSDFERIDKWEKIGIENWGQDMYEKEKE